METDELPECQSPIISQYAAQLHRHSTETPLQTPTNDSPPYPRPVNSPVVIHTPSVHDSLEHNTPSVHGTVSLQLSPVDKEMIDTNQNSPKKQPSHDPHQVPTPATAQPSHQEPNSAIYDAS